jgi:hypothetical protein
LEPQTVTSKAKLFSVSMTALLAAPVAAQGSSWSFALSPYLWAPGISSSVGTRWGTVDVDKSTGDVLSSLDLAFMGALEARNGRWGLIADLFYAELSQSRATPLGLLFSRARTEITAKELSGYVAYRINENERVTLDLMGGVRVSSIDLDLSLSPGLLAGQSIGVSQTWVDPVIGARARVALSDAWFATAFGDVGGTGGDSDLTWQVFASIGYQIDPRWSVQGGWRYFSAEKEIEGRDVEIDFSGPLLGFTARF